MKNKQPVHARKLRWVLWAILLLLLFVVVLLVLIRPSDKPPVENEVRPVPVRVHRVKPRPRVDTLILPGRLEARRDAWLATERAGRVVAIHADRGDIVRKGDVLLEVNDRVWQTVLDRAETEFREAGKEYERIHELREAGAVSEQDFDAVAARLEQAEAAQREARAFVEQCAVRAPFDGLLDDRSLDLGEYAMEGRAALRLVDVDPLTLRFSVPERDVYSLEPGTRISFTLDARPGDVYEAVVRAIAFTADPGANTFRVEADVANPGNRFRSGLIARVRLDRRRWESALTAPLSAIMPRRGEEVLFVVENDHAVRRVVVLDALVGTDAVLSRGLAAGDLLVVEGHRDLGDGDKVRVLETRSGKEPLP